jgi:hypothetical protein
MCVLTEQSVFMSLPFARPIVHMLSYSPVTARADVAMPIKKAPARAERTYVLMFISSVRDLRRSFQNTIVHLGSSVGDGSHVFVTDIIGPKDDEDHAVLRQHDPRLTQNRQAIVQELSSHDRERRA